MSKPKSKTKPARLDADRTAKPKTRIVQHARIGKRIGPGIPLQNPEYEDESGKRTPLQGLSKKNEADLARAAASVQDGDLYQALKGVGDDTVKSEIEWALKKVLDEATFRKVVGVFKVAVTDS